MRTGAPLFRLRWRAALDELVWAIDLPVHCGTFANRIEQRPIAVFEVEAIGKRCPGLHAQRRHYAVVAVVTLRHHGDEGRDQLGVRGA